MNIQLITIYKNNNINIETTNNTDTLLQQKIQLKGEERSVGTTSECQYLDYYEKNNNPDNTNCIRQAPIHTTTKKTHQSEQLNAYKTISKKNREQHNRKHNTNKNHHKH